MALWKTESLVEATGREAENSLSINGVTIDSRRIAADDLFVALPGERVDGHQFVPQALASGASACMVSMVSGDVDHTRLVVVDDTLSALQAMGAYARKRTQAAVVGVTGSVGKTSAKEMLHHALSACGRSYATQGNYNNHIGVPLTLANMPVELDYAVIEMGMNHTGEIAQLTGWAQPDVALITAIEAAHTEFFDGVEGIAAAKMEICEGLTESGALMLPADSPYFDVLQQELQQYQVARQVTFGATEGSDYRLLGYISNAYGCEVEAMIGGTHMTYRLGMIGRHWALLSVGVLGVVDLLGADLAVAAGSLEMLREPEGRGRLMQVELPEGGHMLLIDDSYNASPVSMQAAFAKLQELRSHDAGDGRVVLVLGEMLELGEQSPVMHLGLRDGMLATGAQQVFLVGDAMKPLAEQVSDKVSIHWAQDASSMQDELLHTLQPGDTVLVKGSHGSQVYRLAAALKALTKEGERAEEETVDAL